MLPTVREAPRRGLALTNDQPEPFCAARGRRNEMETAPGCLPARVGGATRQGAKPPRGVKIKCEHSELHFDIRVLNIWAKPYYRIMNITGIYYRGRGLKVSVGLSYKPLQSTRFSAYNLPDSAYKTTQFLPKA
jgi:hypothetical protein